MKKYCLIFLVAFSNVVMAQKKTLDHTVYDSWKSLGERMISNDGNFIVYTVNPQEGDGELIIQNPTTKYKKVIPRGYNATITDDSKYLVFKIKPFFKDTRQAKIKKKKGDDLPKDSLAIIQLGQDSVVLLPKVKSYKIAEKGSGFVAYQLEKLPADTSKKKIVVDSSLKKNDQLIDLADSIIQQAIDSIKGNINKEKLTGIINKAANQIIKNKLDAIDADGEDEAAGASAVGTNVVIRNLANNTTQTFNVISEYLFNKNGDILLLETTKKAKDTTSKAMVLLVHLTKNKVDTIFNRFNDAKNYVFDDAGNQIAFVAERDSSEKALQKFYKLYYYAIGKDSAQLIVDKNTVGMPISYTVSDNARLDFSKDGSKLFFGNTPIRAPKDTTLVDFELASLDVWHYKDDYLQTQQLKNVTTDLKKAYTAVYHIDAQKTVQLGSTDIENITLVDEGNANWVLGETTKGNRIEAQWQGKNKYTTYMLDVQTGNKKNIFTNSYNIAKPSPSGKFVYWFDEEKKHYFTYNVTTGITKNISVAVPQPLYDIENDVPDLPNAYGTMGWHEGDSSFYVYDQFDIWKLDPNNATPPTNLNLPFGRNKNTENRYVRQDVKERFIKFGNLMTFTSLNKTTKHRYYYCRKLLPNGVKDYQLIVENKNCNFLLLAKNSLHYIYTTESYQQSANLFAGKFFDDVTTETKEKNNWVNLQLSDINPQQNEYNWGTTNLYKWKTYTGKMSEGIVYKPEDFDATKKYPMICYFYEKLSDGLNNYQAPAPTPSRLNIPFFVSRGYIVFVPDISYTTGHPGNDAYNYIVSGARALVKDGFVDSTKIGIQGQSWGGYQVAYLVTKTKLFAAAWAGAPVANMTSAYGGIRWESGLNRQFQYEKQQSRIGASLWDKPQLYIENSPLFHLPKVQTPLAIMHNDADGAVPWYQGIELFTALRRLGKPVWLLNYNGEAHNLMERRNRKDIQIREQQFFDWLLKGQTPTTWITDGVPATDKGKKWGL